MGEKRGETEKLKYDFNTAGVLEVEIKGVWYRVTSREFRSFDGNRRIGMPYPNDPRMPQEDIILSLLTYNGPIYIYNTNREVNRRDTGQIVGDKVRQDLLQVSSIRDTKKV